MASMRDFVDSARRRAFLAAIRRQQPWWIALGVADAQGVTCGGQHRPWASLAEQEAWTRWSTGSGDARA